MWDLSLKLSFPTKVRPNCPMQGFFVNVGRPNSNLFVPENNSANDRLKSKIRSTLTCWCKMCVK